MTHDNLAQLNNGLQARATAFQEKNDSTGGGEFLTFRLGLEEYGIDILKVQEIRSYETPTRIASAPDFINGVINLRGIIVPIIDLRMMFKMKSADYNDFTVVIVLNLDGGVVGVVVDSVSDVTQLDPGQIRPSSTFGQTLDASCLLGLGTIAGTDAMPDRMLVLVDIEALMHGAEAEVFDRASAAH